MDTKKGKRFSLFLEGKKRKSLFYLRGKKGRKMGGKKRKEVLTLIKKKGGEKKRIRLLYTFPTQGRKERGETGSRKKQDSF